jgi:EmrB/QacA subfamily drug resistance transporter
MRLAESENKTLPGRPADPGWGTLLVLMTATFMSSLDVFIVNVAIPSIQRDLHAGSGQILWATAGFGLAVGVAVITGGRLGDMYGRRRMFVTGLVLFTAMSALCGAAPGATFLAVARVAQGLSAALMTPQVLAIAGAVYSGSRLTRAFTAYGLTMGMAAVFGQLIGGMLIQSDLLHLGWRSCFLINVPIGVLAVALTRRFVPAVSGTGRARLDLGGVALLSSALAATALPLMQGQAQGWPLWTKASFAGAAVLFACFGLFQRRLAGRGGAPLIDPRMFADRGFTTGMIVQLVAWMGQGAFFLVFALYLQDGLRLSALASGVVFIGIGSGYIITSTLSGVVARRLGRQTVTTGATLMIVGLAGLAAASAHIGTAGNVWLLGPGLFVDGAGMGLIIAPLTSIVLARVAPGHAGVASGVMSTVVQVGGSLGIAVIGVVYYGHLTGALAADIPGAFGVSLWYLIAVAAGVVVTIQLVPRRARTAR